MPAEVSEDTPEYIRQLTHNQRVMMDKAAQVLDATHALNLKKWKEGHKSNISLHQRLLANPEEGVWVLARVRDDAPLEKWKPRWAGPFRLLDFKSQTQSIVRLWDTVNNKVIEAHLNDVELWDHRFTESVEGLKKVAEYDGWQYPMDGITAMALTPADPDEEYVMLDTSRPRTNKNKYAYSFYVKWRNYEEQSWVKYNGLKDTSTFQVWANAHPALKFSARIVQATAANSPVTSLLGHAVRRSLTSGGGVASATARKPRCCLLGLVGRMSPQSPHREDPSTVMNGNSFPRVMSWNRNAVLFHYLGVLRYLLVVRYRNSV
jgi:hypothetical protein